jgi:hypothetical protein
MPDSGAVLSNHEARFHVPGRWRSGEVDIFQLKNECNLSSG